MLTIRLLGSPALLRDGRQVRSPRGRKTWALLGYVLLAERPPARRRLAELLFDEADDPLGALRWSLAELRRALGLPDAFTGDPLTPELGAGAHVDVLSIDDPDPAGLLDLDGELLDGLGLPANPAFESWLLVERHRVSARIEARQHHAAIALLAENRARDAIPFASRVVARNPLDESNQELLVRALAMAGDPEAARKQVAVAEDTLRRELGIGISSALRDAATVSTGSAMVLPSGGRAAALSQLEAGRAAILAGATDAGIQCLRRAVVEAARCADTALHACALATLGSALVHAVRGRDEEGAVILHESVHMAIAAGDRATAAQAHRELGFIEVQAGRPATAEAMLIEAQALADDDADLAAVLGVRGMNASDRGDYPAAFAFFEESVQRAVAASDQRQHAWSLTLTARAHLLRSEHSQAAAALTPALAMVREQRWLAFQPLPQVLLAEAQLRMGDTDGAADGLELAWALACQVGDPCWEGFAARGLGLLHADRGDPTVAAGWLGEAIARCTRVSDRYSWLQAHLLDTMIGAALDRHDHESAARHVPNLAALAARGDMRELVVRAQVHRSRLGEPAALASARLLASDIDNPALARMLSGEPLGRTG